MNKQKLMKVTYYDEKNSIRLTGYADTVVWDEKGKATLAALRFGGYPEEVRGLADAIYGGITIEIESEDGAMTLSTLAKQYRRVLSYDGVYAEATLIAEDDGQTAKNGEKKTEDDANAALAEPQTELDLPPRNTYIFCTPGDKADLFRAVDQKTAVPLIPEFQDYVLSELTRRKILRPLRVKSISRKMEAWLLRCEEKDKNIVAVLESGLKSGAIAIPGAVPGPSPLDKLESVTDYLNTFGVTVAERIKNLFVPLFDPSKEPLSPEVLAVNQYIHDHAGYSLYDAQLAVAESVKRQLQRNKVGLIVAECGAGKTKIGAAAIASTAAGLYAQHKNAGLFKTFNVVLCPSHVTKKWVREVEETVPNTFAAVVHSIQEFDHLYQMYERGTKSCFAILSKEKARDGYMRAPAVLYRQWNREGLQIDRKTPLPDCGAANERPDTPVFCCPECGTAVMANISRDGTVYRIPANSLFFRREHRENHKCEACGASLWTALNPSAWGRQKAWAKIGDYGFVYRPLIDEHIRKAKSEALKEKLGDLSMTPGAVSAARGANRAFPLSSYIKRKYKGRIYGLIVDELHQYNNKSGQGDAMAELYDTAKKVVGMTATLINGYSSGIFYLRYRMVPSLMKKDGKDYETPTEFDKEYGVIQTTYEEVEPEYNSNRRTVQSRVSTRLLPGVSPLVYSRFLLEYTSFLSLSDMGKDLPDYEEIPVPLDMPEQVRENYKRAEQVLQKVLKEDRKTANKLLSTYMNLLTVYPDQPYDQPEIVHPINGNVILTPANAACFDDILPKEEKVLQIVRDKVAAGGRVLVYTSWTRTDSQQKLLKLLTQAGYRTEILATTVPPNKREEWVEKRVRSGLQVLITNQKCVETGLDLNDFTTLIFYSMGFNLFTLRQASRRSWRINQAAPRVEVYLLYYKDTLQAKAMKLMASKLAVAGIIEGTLSEEGLAAMSDVRDLTSQMAKELSLGIKDNVEDIAAAFKKMAVINPERRTRTVVQPTTELPAPEEVTIKAVSAHTRRKEFDGLLERTLEEQKKKKKPKKPVVDEDQFTLDGFAA